jgi:hypothetical protein
VKRPWRFAPPFLLLLLAWLPARADEPAPALASFEVSASWLLQSLDYYTLGPALAYAPRFHPGFLPENAELAPRIELQATRDPNGKLFPLFELGEEMLFPVTGPLSLGGGAGLGLSLQPGSSGAFPLAQATAAFHAGPDENGVPWLRIVALDRVFIRYELLLSSQPVHVFELGVGWRWP